ncbi:hypothetical protein [Chryseobacterium sp. JUb7]|uniref:hypothetical protein n=1 Tax=Chryseobacterium sp. JUb7 TaxID=2940599 RepID=UPI002169794A|nr:hypothetical protein [Chryseobacterium sp. JUb7]MCS3529228.1 hypothetical protein [Chryseobacterium sp. JUb7]
MKNSETNITEKQEWSLDHLQHETSNFTEPSTFKKQSSEQKLINQAVVLNFQPDEWGEDDEKDTENIWQIIQLNMTSKYQ